MRSVTHERSGAPVLLADQLVAWKQNRAGWGVTDTGAALRRLPTETRRILNGDPVSYAFTPSVGPARPAKGTFPYPHRSVGELEALFEAGVIVPSRRPR